MLKPSNRFTIELKRLAFEHFNSCTNCGHNFVEGEHSFSGYFAEDEPAYLCNNCSGKLTELAARTYFIPRPYEVPPADIKLWRYMDFTKYVSLLSSRGLYFTRTDCFEDIFEGAKGLKKNKDKWDSHYLNFFRSAIKNPPDGYKCELSDSEVDEQAQKLLTDLEVGGESDKRQTFVSCWHESEHESEAMWRLYSSFLANAVAIRTSYRNLYASLGRDPSIKIGRIEYIDLKKDYAGINDAFWRKRKSFEHEREVRALLSDFNCKDLGKIVPCDLAVLIEEVFVSPKAPPWFVHLLNDINEKYGVKVTVSQSELVEEPFF